MLTNFGVIASQFKEAPSGDFEATGGTITTSGSYTIHTFLSSGTFEVTSGTKSVEYLIVGGGASGSHGTSGLTYGGAGGGGGVVEDTLDAVVGNYAIVVGDGGAAVNGNASDGYDGGNSSITDPDSVAVTAYGGIKGGANGNGGASGAPQSYAGVVRSGIVGGGGGGAGGAGSTTTGGAGVSSSISGSAVIYSGGGGGSNDSVSGAGGGAGGKGGKLSVAPTSGVRGGGGGSTRAENANPSGAGGSGVVIIRYLT